MLSKIIAVMKKEKKKTSLLISMFLWLILTEIIFPFQPAPDPLDFHTSTINALSVGDKIFTGDHISDLLEENYRSVQTLSENGLSCLKNFQPKKLTGASSSYFAIKIQTKETDLYYRVYMYQNNFFYVAPYMMENGIVRVRLKLIRINCNYNHVATY